ncbi:MAG TPA: gluconeogenesis factor YvcK family protein [Candidatus Limnocylindrales bacterium]
MNLRRWLTPGIGIKRWLLVVFVGELGLALAGALALRQVYREFDAPRPFQPLVSALTLQFLPYGVRGALLGGLGLLLFLYGSWRVVRVLVAPFLSADPEQPLVEVIYQKRFLARGPRIVAIGGGTGLSTLLRGLKEHSSNITAIVAMADDGGSTGALRQALGVPPVGDIRNCIVALADAEPLMGRLLQYRFPEEQAGSLAGHAVGNLLIAAMTSIQGDDFEEAVREMNRVLAVRGKVVPSSPVPLTLHARLRDGSEVTGQSRITRTASIEQVWLSPSGVAACEDALRAIEEADLIVLGPGSLYTSILPSLLVDPLREAVLASPALRLFICNVATQRGETEGYDLADHVVGLEQHTAAGLVDVVLANNHFGVPVPGEYSAEPVRLRWPPGGFEAPKLVLDDVVDRENPHHHDPARLAAAVVRVWERERLARRRPRVASSA